MGLFDFFKKKDPNSPPREVREVMKKMARMLEGRKLADRAISYRNVGDFDKALRLLYRALTEFDYKPAILLIGNTAVKKGDIGNAIRWFKLQIKEQANKDGFPLIELYANLGSIYHNHCKEHTKALNMYNMALKAPRPKSLSTEAYAFMESNIFHDVACVYLSLGNGMKARTFAEKSLRVQPDCPTCRKIAGNVFTAQSRSGKVAGVVSRDSSGRNTITVDKEKPNSLYHSMCLVFAQDLSVEERTVFCQWAGLSQSEWTTQHIELCALALMHYTSDAKETDLDRPALGFPPLTDPVF